MRALVLALDLGSSSVRTALFGTDGRRLLPSTASGKYSIAYTAQGGAELDPAALLREARRCSRCHTCFGTGAWPGVPRLSPWRDPGSGTA